MIYCCHPVGFLLDCSLSSVNFVSDPNHKVGHQENLLCCSCTGVGGRGGGRLLTVQIVNGAVQYVQ